MAFYLGTNSTHGSQISVSVYEEGHDGFTKIGELDSSGAIRQHAALPNPKENPRILAEALLKFSPLGEAGPPQGIVDLFKDEFLLSVNDLLEQNKWWIEGQRISRYLSHRSHKFYVPPPILGRIPDVFGRMSPRGAIVLEKAQQGFEVSDTFSEGAGKTGPLNADQASSVVLSHFPFVTRETEALRGPLARYFEEGIKDGEHRFPTEKISSWARMQLRGLDNDLRPTPPTRTEIVDSGPLRGFGANI